MWTRPKRPARRNEGLKSTRSISAAGTVRSRTQSKTRKHSPRSAPRDERGSNPFEDQRAVGSTEPERIGERSPNRHAPRLVGNVVEVASGILIEQVGGRGSDLIAYGQDREYRFDPAGRPE